MDQPVKLQTHTHLGSIKGQNAGVFVMVRGMPGMANISNLITVAYGNRIVTVGTTMSIFARTIARFSF